MYFWTSPKRFILEIFCIVLWIKRQSFSHRAALITSIWGWFVCKATYFHRNNN